METVQVPVLFRQIDDLEQKLSVSDIIVFRKLAESAVEASRQDEERNSTLQ